MSANSISTDIGDNMDDSQMLESDDSNDPFISLVYDERSSNAVQLVRDATLWVGNLPEPALRGLTTQGSCAVSALFPGKDVVAVTVRRKEDIGIKRKSWALVTFGSKELAEAILDETTPQYVAGNLQSQYARFTLARLSFAHSHAALVSLPQTRCCCTVETWCSRRVYDSATFTSQDFVGGNGCCR